MKSVLAALDNSATAASVAAAGRALAAMLDVEVAAVHVQENGAETARSVAKKYHLELLEVRGTPVERLADLLGSDEIAAVAVGARRDLGGPRPVGSTALAIVERATKPVLVVPPEASVPEVFQRALVPLDATLATARAVSDSLRAAATAGIDLTALHVFADRTIPRFWDQPAHAEHAWASEFLSRFCGEPGAHVEIRTGAPGHEVLVVAEEEQIDLIILAWLQTFADGRAELVREVLSNAVVPVLLVPVDVGAEVAA